jgi:hypothetical protein
MFAPAVNSSSMRMPTHSSVSPTTTWGGTLRHKTVSCAYGANLANGRRENSACQVDLRRVSALLVTLHARRRWFEPSRAHLTEPLQPWAFCRLWGRTFEDKLGRMAAWWQHAE